MLVWMLEGERAGQFIPVSASEGRKLIAEGKAQHGNTAASKILRPGQYKTRELTASEPTTEDIPEPPAEVEPDEEESTPEVKPKRKAKAKAPAADDETS